MKQRDTFQSPYDQYAEHIGKRITSVAESSEDLYDREETGPLYDITLEDGTAIQAWPEEVFADQGWDPDAP